jgi:pilus assembly protein CpaB
MSRISPATMTAVIFAILVGLAGAYSVRMYLSDTGPVAEVEAPPAPTMVFVPVAAREMEIGQIVSINDIVVQKYTQEEFKDSPYADRLFMTDTVQMDGRQLQRAVSKGDEFAPDSFFATGMGPSVTTLLKPGFRAVTIPIKNVGAVEGFASPSAMVDVLFRSISSADRPEVTLTLLEMVEVLAVDRNVLPGQLPGTASGRPATVTLAVTPEQAKALKAVEDRGELSLTLRHPDDGATVVSSGLKSDDKVTIDQIIGAPARKQTATLEIYYGGKRQEFTFKDSPKKDQRNNQERIETPIRPETSVAKLSPAPAKSPVPELKQTAAVKSPEKVVVAEANVPEPKKVGTPELKVAEQKKVANATDKVTKPKKVLITGPKSKVVEPKKGVSTSARVIDLKEGFITGARVIEPQSVASNESEKVAVASVEVETPNVE